MIQYITSKTNNRIKDLLRLRQNKNRQESKLFIVEGFHMLEMASEAQIIKEVYTTKELDIDQNIPQFIITNEILDKISSSINAQGVVVVCHYIKEKPITSNKIIYLDNISDPGNLGTILRTALAFNYLDVIVSPNCVSLYNDKSLSATQGAIFKLNIITKDIDYLKELKKDYKIIATSLKNSVDITSIPKYEKCILVFGNEGKGVREEILNISDVNVIIPIQNIDSLNVGVASGIVMFYEASEK